MKKPLEAVTAAQAASADTAMALMRNTLDAIDRLAALNLNTLRDSLEASANQSGKLAGVKDISKAAEILAQPNMDRTRAYYHQVYELMSEMQEQMTKVMQAHYAALSESATSASQAFAANAPVGGDAFAKAMKAMLDSSAQTFERLNETAHQIQAGARDLGESVAKQAAPVKSAAAKATSSARKKTAS